MPQGVLFGGYVVFWSAMGISPLDRENWVLSSILPLMLVAALLLGRRALRFSTVSCAAMVAFLTLHTIGAHYTYAQVPAGVWLQHALHLERNHFDRITHFAFGLFFTYPLFEVFRLRLAEAPAVFAYYVTLVTQLGLAGIWEIVEAAVAHIAHPELGTAFVGSQGDIWDAQHDMLAATCGAVLALLAIAAGERWARRWRSPTVPAEHPRPRDRQAGAATTRRDLGDVEAGVAVGRSAVVLERSGRGAAIAPCRRRR
jgi:putative membrane protein